MKNLKLYIILIIAGLFNITNIFAQDRPAESQSLVNNLYSNHNLYNGIVGVSIPLYEIPIGNLKLSNHLTYTSSPFEPNMDESMYGLNWNGNSFGQITREVNKDFLFRQYLAERLGKGLGAAIQDNVKERQGNDCIVQKQDFVPGFSISKKQILLNPNISQIKNEYKPDRFYFDFLGYKGYFVYDNNGNVLVFCENAKLKVINIDTASPKCYSVTANIDYQNKNISEITIIDDKGNTFYFGGSYDSTETSYAQYACNVKSSGISYNGSTRANYIVSWNLKKIKLANGDMVVATYKPGNSSIFNDFLQTTVTADNFPTSFPSNSQKSQANINTSTSFDIKYSNSNDFSGVNTIVTKRAILENIEVVNKNINIHYNYFNDNNGLIHMSGIDISYFGKSENIVFNQIQLGGQNSRYFLASVLKSNDQKYLFDYYKTDNLPMKGSAPINEYGYWYGDENYDATLLKKITYPTQGSEEYTYEKTDASQWSILNSAFVNEVNYNIHPKYANNIPIPRLASKIIRNSIETYITNYKYRLNGKSSGIYKYFQQPQNYISGKKTSPEPFYYSYITVQEEIENKGRTEYVFTNLSSNPDINNAKYIDGNSIAKTNQSIPSNEYQRGKLMRKAFYDSSDKILKEYIYSYQTLLKQEDAIVDARFDNCTTCEISDDSYYVSDEIMSRNLNSSPSKSVTVYVPVIPYLLTKVMEYDYIGVGAISSVINMTYRKSNIFWHPYPEEIETITKSGTSIKKILYAHNLGSCTSCPTNNTIVGGQHQTYSAMLDSNIMSPIIEITKNNNNKYFLQENLFHAYPFIRKTTRQSKLNANIDFINYQIPVEETISSNSNDLLDDRANIIQTTDKSGVPRVTIYGYKQTLPILKIEGINYEQLMQILGQATTPTSYLNLDIVAKSDIDLDASSEQNLINSLNIFRNNPSLKDYIITTYTYDPLVGVTSITPPSGIRENYKYDTQNRLYQIIDINGKIIKEYKYNYAPKKFYNDKYTKDFYKSDCPNSTIAQPYTYIVPANKYTSIISTSDANQMAYDEAYMNGQNAANINGICTPVPVCTVDPSYNTNIYYSSFQEMSPNNIKAILSLSLVGQNGSANLNWSDGVMIGILSPSCRPNSYKNIDITSNGSSWNISIGYSGNVTIKQTGGIAQPYLSLYFEYTK